MPLLTVAGLCLLSAVAPAGPGSGDDSLDLLRYQSWLTPADRATLDRGGAVARVVDTDDRSEVLSVAVARVKTTPARALEVLRNVGGEPWVLQSGRLREAPYDRDFASLTLNPGEVKDLSKCRINNCEIRLPADAIERFRK